MNKKFQIIAIAALLAGAPLYASEATEMDGQDSEMTGIAVTFSGNSAHVTGAAGTTLEIYNLAGVRISSTKIDSADKTVNFNLAKGTYIIKVGNVVRKISIR